MGRLRDEIKQEIRDEVKDIVYEKAKAEIKQRIDDKVSGFKQRVLRFFGIKNTQKEKINQISEEIKGTYNPVLDDEVLGTFELFSYHFGVGVLEMLSSAVASKSHTSNPHKNDL